MSETKKYFSASQLRQVSQDMQKVSAAYEQLFSDLAAQMYTDIAGIDTPSEAVSTCNKQAEEALALFHHYFPDQPVIACHKGCAHCCSFPIEAPPQVIIDIAQYILATFSEKKQQELKQKLHQDIQKRKGPLFRHPCVFLDLEGACTIYEKRPSACRSFSSGDPLICRQSVDDGRIIDQHPLLYRIYQSVTSVLIADAKDSGKYDKQLPFTSSLLKALEATEGEELWPGFYRLGI